MSFGLTGSGGGKAKLPKGSAGQTFEIGPDGKTTIAVDVPSKSVAAFETKLDKPNNPDQGQTSEFDANGDMIAVDVPTKVGEQLDKKIGGIKVGSATLGDRSLIELAGQNGITLTIDEANNKITLSLPQSNAVGGFAQIASDGKIPSGLLNGFTMIPQGDVANMAARLALTAPIGTLVKQVDTDKIYLLTKAPSTDDASWLPFTGVNFPVTSVFGRSGAIVATDNDYSAQQISISLAGLTATNLKDAISEVKSYADGLVAGAVRVAGFYDASLGVYPSTGTGVSGAIRRGDQFEINVAGTIDGKAYDIGDSLRALVATPGQITANWGASEHNTMQATEALRGTAAIASNAEAIDSATTENTKIITPKKLWAALVAFKTYLETKFFTSDTAQTISVVKTYSVPQQYASDLKSSYSDRSLIDKGYAEERYQKILDGLKTGGAITIPATTATITASTYLFNGLPYAAPLTTIPGINPSAADMFRWVVFYGTTSNTVGMVSGAESASPVEPAIPANTVRFGASLVSDAGAGNVAPDVSGFVDKTTDQTVGGKKTMSSVVKYASDQSANYDNRTLIDKGYGDTNYQISKITVSAHTTLTAAQLPLKRNVVVQNTSTGIITLTLPATYAFSTTQFGNSTTTVNIPAGGNVFLLANTITTVDIVATNYVGNVVRKLARVMLKQTTAQSVSQNTNIKFQSIENSQLPDGVTTPMWSSAADTDVIIRSAGLYSITGAVRVNDAASGERSATITVNGVFQVASGSSATNPAVVATSNPSTIVYLNVGDIVRLLWYSNTTVNTDPGLNTVRLNVVQLSGEYLTVGTYVTTTYGFSKLSGVQTLSANGVIAISGAQSPNNTIDMSGNKVTLKAGRTYKLMGDVAFDGNASAGAFLFVYWRKVGTTAEVGKTALRLASSFNGNFSENGSAMAIIKVGATDEQYELFGEVGGTASIPVRTSGFEVQEIVPTPVATEPIILPYSSLEKATGRTWTDGRPIYEKTFDLTSTSTPTSSSAFNSGTALAHGITNLAQVLEIKGMATEGVNHYILPYVGGTNFKINGANATTITFVTTSTGTSWAATARLAITITYLKTA